MSRYYPDRLYNYDAEDEEERHIGETDQGEEVSVSRRVAESDLLVYVNVNYIPMDGGHKSVHTGLAPLLLHPPSPHPQHAVQHPLPDGPTELRHARLHKPDGQRSSTSTSRSST